jgi:signal transduction histidine kinase
LSYSDSLPQRTEVLYGGAKVIDNAIRFISNARRKIDACVDNTRPSLAIGIQPLKKSFVSAKERGIRVSYVTEITNDNVLYCNELVKMLTGEVRHLDGIKCNFYISDTEYIAPATFHERGKPASQMIYSNVREIVEHQQYVFDTLWNKAIPAEVKIKEIEQGLVPDFIDTIRDPHEIQKLGFDVIKSAKKEILVIFSTANAFLRQQKVGAIESIVRQAMHHKAKIKILTPINETVSGSIKDLILREKEKIDIEIRNMESPLQTRVTILIADRKLSLAVELKDDSKNNSDEAIGLGVYSNSRSTVLSYASIFESLWNQSDLYERLKIHDNMQKEFINIAAHELRNPIQPILGLSEVLKSKEGDIKQHKELIDAINRNAKTLRRLTENILEVTRIESKSLKLNKEAFSLGNMVNNAIDEYRKEIERKNLKIDIVYQQESIKTKIDGFVVEADKYRLSQVISNLFSNAINFTKEGGSSIFVSLEREETGRHGYKKNHSSIIMSIKDTGTGIDPEIFPRLFTKFATKSKKGTGLGLYISKSIIEAHGGKIWAEDNKDGKLGAVFRFSLPTSNNNK